MWTTDAAAFASAFGLSARQCRRFQLTAEHLVPRSAGGGNSRSNIAAACVHCNTARHRLRRPPCPQNFRELVRTRMRCGRWHPQWATRVAQVAVIG
jgi:hypothetical protein